MSTKSGQVQTRNQRGYRRRWLAPLNKALASMKSRNLISINWTSVLTLLLYASTSVAWTPKSAPVELPLTEKVNAHIIFVGTVSEIVWTYPSWAPRPKPVSPSEAPTLLAVIQVTSTLKTHDGDPLPKRVLVPIGSTFELPWAEIRYNWEKLTTELMGQRFVFFGYHRYEDERWTVINTVRQSKAEPGDKERLIRTLLRLTQ